jgi:hypothetical protein
MKPEGPPARDSVVRVASALIGDAGCCGGGDRRGSPQPHHRTTSPTMLLASNGRTLLPFAGAVGSSQRRPTGAVDLTRPYVLQGRDRGCRPRAQRARFEQVTQTGRRRTAGVAGNVQGVATERRGQSKGSCLFSSPSPPETDAAIGPRARPALRLSDCARPGMPRSSAFEGLLGCSGSGVDQLAMLIHAPTSTCAGARG